jgi:hypothetical protein
MQIANLSPPCFTPAQNRLMSDEHAFLTAVAALNRDLWQLTERSSKWSLTQAPTRPPPGCTLAHRALISAAQALAEAGCCPITPALEMRKTAAVAKAILIIV